MPNKGKYDINKTQLSTPRIRTNHFIKAPELRVITSLGENLGVLSIEKALHEAQARGQDLIEISPNANPPVAKIMDYGKFQYEERKKQKVAKSRTHTSDIKNIQVKIGTGEHDLGLKAKKASEWLGEGHRVKIDLFLIGRSKYMDINFLKERMDRIFKLITVEYKIASPPMKGPKGLTAIIEKK
ncbi:MAG TPA: translation initiation factor IF-3 [Candidatus Paceibacterota bacterium]